ncbi:MAG: TfoX/Sxy family protein [Burkholderiales bacterium]
MASSPELVSHCVELLSPLGSVRTRRMFGGTGFYVDELFLALIAGEQLYLKVDVQTRPLFEAAGCEPFIYDSAGKNVSLGYFSAPEDAMESPPLMLPWARHALAAALRARAAKPVAARPVRKASPRKGSASKAPPKL